jgi:hypothetical protein
MRIQLTPTMRRGIAVVNIVTEGLLLTPTQVWLLLLKARIGPVLIEIQHFSDPHCMDHVILTPPAS